MEKWEWTEVEVIGFVHSNAVQFLRCGVLQKIQWRFPHGGGVAALRDATSRFQSTLPKPTSTTTGHTLFSFSFLSSLPIRALIPSPLFDFRKTTAPRVPYCPCFLLEVRFGFLLISLNSVRSTLVWIQLMFASSRTSKAWANSRRNGPNIINRRDLEDWFRFLFPPQPNTSQLPREIGLRFSVKRMTIKTHAPFSPVRFIYLIN